MLAMVMQPAVTYLEKTVKLPRVIATFTILLFVFVLMAGILFIVMKEIIDGSLYMAEHLPLYYQILMSHIEQFIQIHFLPIYEKLSSIFRGLQPTQQELLQEQIERLIQTLVTVGSQLLKQTFANIPAFLSLIPVSFTVGIFMLLATFLMVLDWDRLHQQIAAFTPKSLKIYSQQITYHFKKALYGYIRAQLILICITALIIYVGLQLIGIKHALTITMITAIAELLPLVGTGLIFIPWIIVLFITGSYALTIKLSILYTIIIIIRQILEPKLVASHIGIHPLVALAVLFIGIQLWGIAGVIAAPFLLIIIQVIRAAGIIKLIRRIIIGNT